MKTFIRYFLQGLLTIVPIAITCWVVFKIIFIMTSLFSTFGLIINPILDPFIVLAAVILLIIFIGMLSSSIVLKPLFNFFHHAIERAPIVKTIYSSIKDLVSAFVGSKKRFNKPVLVTTNKTSGIQQLGFITQTNLQELGIKDKVSVYVPHSYAISGMLLIVPVENIKAINASSAEVMKFIVSGGVTDID